MVDIIKIKAQGLLYINTMNRDVSVTGRIVEAKTVYLDLYGRLSIIEVMNFDVSITAQVGGKFKRRADAVGPNVPLEVNLSRGEWAFSFEARATLFGIAAVNLAGWMQSDGSFGIAIQGSARYGNKRFGFEADISAKLYYIMELEELGFSASLNGEAFLLGVGISLNADVEFNSNDGRVLVHAEAEVEFLFVTVFVEKTWQIGYISKKPNPNWLATTKDGRNLMDNDSVASDGGELYLTIENGGSRLQFG